MRAISFGLLSALIALTAAAPVPDSPPPTLLLELVDDNNLLIGDEELFHHRGGTYRVAPLQRRLSEASSQRKSGTGTVNGTMCLRLAFAPKAMGCISCVSKVDRVLRSNPAVAHCAVSL